MTGIIEFSTDTLNIEVSGINDNIPVDLVEVVSTGQDVYLNIESNYGPVLAVNGRIGFVNLDKSDVGLSNVENISITGVSGYLQYQIDHGTANFRYAPVTGVYNLLSNNRYSFDTLTGLVTGVLPASPQKGDEIELYDSAGTWHLNPLVVDNNNNCIEQKKDKLECNVRHGLIKLIYTTQNNIGWRIYPMSIHNVPLLLQPLIGITGSAISGIIPFNAILTGINLIDPEQGAVDEWYWNLNTGNGYVISGQTIAYTYIQTGLYNVTLSGLNAAGFGITQQLINVFLPYVPNVSITSNKLSGLAPFTGQLSGTNTTQPAQYSPVDNWYWDFNNDAIFDATGQNTQVIYNTTGTYTPTAYGVNLG